jgi:DnaA family protein
MPEQLPLFQPSRTVSFDSYWPGNNAAVIAQMKTQILAPDQPCLFLWGKAGVGKSHLLQAACGFAHQHHKAAVYVPLTDYGTIQPDILQGLENYDLICVDDVDAIVRQKRWEQALFHLFNRARERGALLMFAAAKKPADLEITLPDLLSRLAWGTVWHMEELQDQDKLAALQLHARQSGFSLPDDVGTYLMQRWPRDMHSLFRLLDKLDHASLSEHRKLTIPFVRQFIESNTVS